MLCSNKIKKTALSEPLLSKLRATRKDLEDKRQSLMRVSLQKSIVRPDVKRQIYAAESALKEASELMRMAKPFVKS